MSSDRWEPMIRAAVSRVVCRRAGWEPPEIDFGDMPGFFRVAREHEDRVARWLADHPAEVDEIRAAAVEETVAEHERRVGERLAEWQAERAVTELAALRAFLRGAGVGDRTADAVCASLDETEPMRIARSWVEAKVGALLLLGTKGTGKTVAAAWAMAEVAASRGQICLCDGCHGLEPTSACLVGEGHRARVIRPLWPVSRALFVKAGHLASALHRPDGDDLWRAARSRRVLVIDDLGREYADQHGRWHAELDLLIDDRHEARLRTIMTSNLTADEFKQRYGERVADRIRQDGRVAVCKGDSLRARRSA